MQDVSGMFHKREIGVRNDTYTRAEIDAKDGTIQVAADKAQETADSAVSVNNTQNTQIAALQKSAHSHSNKDVLDKTEQPYTTAERDKLAGLENYVHPTHTAYSRGLYNITVDSEGHVIGATAITKGDITSLGIPGANTTYTFHRDESLNWAESQCNKLQITKHESGVDTQLESIKLIPTVRVSDGFETSGIVYFLTVDSRYCKKDNRNETMWNGDTYDAKTWIRLNTKYSGPVGYKSSAALESEVAIVAPEFIGANATNQKQGLMSPEDKANVDANTAARHTHANKSILDQLNETQWNYINGAANKAHTHDNKDTLDKITDALWNTVYSNTHTHDNKSVLDGTTASYTTADKKKLDGINLTKYLRYNAAGGMAKDTWYKFASFTCTQHYNYSTAIFVAGFGYNLLRVFRITAGNSQGKPEASRTYLTNITGNSIGRVGYIINGNTVNFFLKPATGIYGYVARIGATAETGDFITQTDLVAATAAEAASIVPFTVAGTDVAFSNHSNETDKISNGTLRSGFYVNSAANATTGHVWFRMATCKISGAYETINTTFLITNGMAEHALLSCGIRNNGTGKAVESCLLWISARNHSMPPGLFRVVAINSETGVTYELWGQITARWQGVRYTVLDERNISGGKNIRWILESHSDADAKTAPTSGNMYVDSSDSSICANATNATKWSNLVADISTYNTTDAWLLVNNNGKIQHRLEGDLKVLSATKLATARTLTVGNTGKSFNGAANVSWSLDEIGVLGRNTKGKTYKLNNVSYNGSATDYIFNDYTNNKAGGGEYITVTGSQNIALGGNCIFLAGWRNTAQGNQCVAMGQDNIVAGTANIALGSGNSVTADAQGGLALGNLNTCKANASLAGGWYTEVQKSSNQSIGYGNHVTVGTASCAAFGAYNGYSFSGPYLILGNGTGSARANAFRAAASGVYSSGSYHSSGADYAEYFEWLDGNSKGEDRRGHFVKLDGEKILLAESIEDDILGIVSGNPSVVGDSYEDQWQGQYLTDIYGEPLTEDYTDEDGTTRKVWVLNPDYDPEKVYVPRSERQEWSAVGMMGKLIVIDDGTCSPNDYCVPTTGGIATRSEGRVGYRVLSRIDDTHIKVLIKG